MVNPEGADAREGARTEADREVVAYELIRDQILSGELAPGTRISQSDMAASLGMSRTPVRAAIQRLRGDGLIVMTPEGTRPIVAPLSGDELEVLYQMLGALEGLAARLAARRLTSLRASLLRSAYQNPSDGGASIHRLVVDAVNSPVLTKAVAAIRLPLARYRNLLVNPEQARPRSDLFHRQLVDAVTAGDGEAAQRIMLEHLEDAFAAIVETLREEGHLGVDGVFGGDERQSGIGEAS